MNPRDRLLIGLSIALLAMTGAVLVAYVLMAADPRYVPAALNPATTNQPVTSPMPALAIEPAATAQATQPPATASATRRRPTATRSITPTETPASTRATTRVPIEVVDTVTPTRTRTRTPTSTRTPTATQSPYLYSLQPGYPRYAAYPGGCGWMGFAGEVYDRDGRLVNNVIVRIVGPEYLLLSGNAQVYGINGWVQKVADRPSATSRFYAVQLQDFVGNALSETVTVPTFGDCARNLILVNFAQNK